VGDATVGELAEPFEMSLPAVSRHLKVLTDAGLIERHTEAQWRRCELKAEGLRAAADWIEEYRRFWETQFERLEAYLERTAPLPPEKRALQKGRAHGRKRRS
jgi:DNA-binding transcriptional ArsR family regulator